jgi:sulfate transport system ATP-binding protein
MSIEVKNVTKKFGTFTAVNDVSLMFPGGELVALLGPSGSGKTSLLRIIAGLERADGGQVLFEGEDATERDVRHRGVGFVFQHYALFRHMSVFENVAFGLKVRPRATRPAEPEIREKVDRLLKLVQLDWLANRRPSELSGGQRQRVALARALAVEPRVLLLDEPFGSLDAKVRQELRRWLRRLHDEIRLTSVFVTHDQEEALSMATRIAIMSGGNVKQTGTPRDVYDHPVDRFVANFVGETNFISGSVISENGQPIFAIQGRGRLAAPSGSAAGFVCTARSSPTADFHYLTVLSRLRGPIPTNALPRIANAILSLDAKLEGQEQRSKQNWSARLAEVVQVLLRREPKLGDALLPHPNLPWPAHVAIAASLGSERYLAAARLFSASVQKNPNYAWSGPLIDLLSSLPAEEAYPLFRRQWGNVALRDEILLKLAAKPAAIDRERFIAGLSSLQPKVVQSSLTALLALPRILTEQATGRSPARCSPSP